MATIIGSAKSGVLTPPTFLSLITQKFNPFSTKDVYICLTFYHATTDDVYICPQIKNNTKNPVLCDAFHKTSPVVEKGLALSNKNCWTYENAYWLFVYCIEHFKMAAQPHEQRMNREEALAEVFADQDSDVSDFSESEFMPSVWKGGGRRRRRRRWTWKCSWTCMRQ